MSHYVDESPPSGERFQLDGMGRCLTRFIHHQPREWGEDLPGWGGRCLTSFVNHPPGCVGLSDRDIVGRLSSYHPSF